MDENKQIERAAMLADIDGAEQLYTDRASSFVASTLKESKSTRGGFFQRHRVMTFSASFVTVAAIFVLVFFILKPSTQEFGTPAVLLEQSSVHASKAVVDSTFAVPSIGDSLTVKD